MKKPAISPDQSQFSDKDSATKALEYPFADHSDGVTSKDGAPLPGKLIEVADGVHWLRMPLPFSLDHINLWVLDDGDGVAIVDTGINSPDVMALWDEIFQTHIAGRPVTRIIVTHYHPDHIGLAGWLYEKTGAPIWISRTEYLMTRMLCLDVRAAPPPEVLDFYTAAGWTQDLIEGQRKGGFGGFAKIVYPLPVQFHRIREGDQIEINGRAWDIWVGSGHSPEHACLHCPDLGVMIAGDQVLPRISSNVSVYPTEPEGDPLGDWLRSLHRFKALPEETLVLPAHNEPFYGLHLRLDALIHGHCAKLERLARKLEDPKTALETLDTLFGRRFDNPMLISMATGESIAHLRFLERAGLIERAIKDGVEYYQRTPAPVLTKSGFVAYSRERAAARASCSA